MRLLVVGCSFRTAALSMRERLAVPRERLAEVLEDLAQIGGIEEVLLVSTCNRVEAYCAVSGDSYATAEGGLVDYLATLGQLSEDEMSDGLYRLADEEALRHIFRVTASLDAMVVGEAQITGQVKQAFHSASELKHVSAFLHRCMQRAFNVAKRVRTETDIARHPASVSSVAVDLAGRVFEDLRDVSVLVIGAGEMAELALRHLVNAGASTIHVVNRSIESAERLAAEFSAQAAGLDQLESQLIWADVVISSTGSKEPIITKAMLSRIMRSRKQRQLFLVDIAVPRDVEADVGQLSNVFLFAVDDLQRIVAENVALRQKEAHHGERIVEHEVQNFSKWAKSQGAVPLIKALRERFQQVARDEALRTGKMLDLQTSDQLTALERMSEAIVNKLLHVPTKELKRSATEPDGHTLVANVRRLFRLEERESDGE
ncbi:MAG: glutamyl-tRNA reductase [Deltaproteobacteria bacterium]|nr:glutamyl-tRNA reductase [Deltaproteobacteria bacterium]